VHRTGLSSLTPKSIQRTSCFALRQSLARFKVVQRHLVTTFIDASGLVKLEYKHYCDEMLRII
jgi:hypothetical protein